MGYVYVEALWLLKEIWRTRKLLSFSLSAHAFLAGQVLLTVRTAVIVDIWRAVVQITSVGKRATIVRTTTSVELESVVPRVANARRNVQMASVEKIATFARPVHSAVLESVVPRVANARRNVQMASVEKSATLARTTTSVELESVAPRTATARRNVQMASVEMRVTFARTVHSAVLESAAIRMETASSFVVIRFLLEQSSQALLSPLWWSSPLLFPSWRAVAVRVVRITVTVTQDKSCRLHNPWGWQQLLLLHSRIFTTRNPWDTTRNPQDTTRHQPAVTVSHLHLTHKSAQSVLLKLQE